MQREPRQARPWRSDTGEPPPQTLCYDTGREPLLRILVGGTWRHAVVHQRQIRTDGVVYHVSITLPDGDGGQATHGFFYYWNPEIMKPIPREIRPRPELVDLTRYGLDREQLAEEPPW